MQMQRIKTFIKRCTSCRDILFIGLAKFSVDESYANDILPRKKFFFYTRLQNLKILRFRQDVRHENHLELSLLLSNGENSLMRCWDTDFKAHLVFSVRECCIQIWNFEWDFVWIIHIFCVVVHLLRYFNIVVHNYYSKKNENMKRSNFIDTLLLMYHNIKIDFSFNN